MHYFKNKLFLLALYLFIHILILNLFYGSSEGLSIYWQENFNVKAIVVYILSILVTVGFYYGITRVRALFSEKVKTL